MFGRLQLTPASASSDYLLALKKLTTNEMQYSISCLLYVSALGGGDGSTVDTAEGVVGGGTRRAGVGRRRGGRSSSRRRAQSPASR